MLYGIGYSLFQNDVPALNSYIPLDATSLNFDHEIDTIHFVCN
jgi:hypothetical protein